MTGDEFLSYFDQIRYIAGILFLVFLFCHNILPARRHYRLRFALCALFAVLAALARVPLWALLSHFGTPFAIVPYWLLMDLVPVAMILLCYETNLAGALFRAILGALVENVATVFVYHLFVLCLFPNYPREHPGRYVAITILVYGAVLLAAWFLLRKRVSVDESAIYPDPKASARQFALIYLFYIIMISAVQFFCEYMLVPLQGVAEYHGIYLGQCSLLACVMLLISVVMTVILLSIYQILTLRNEKQIITRMAHDRQAQYEYSKENIEMINRKVHDLKHQLRALEFASDGERRQQLEEVQKAADLYDAVVKTGNEALDTLLTEKSVYCKNRDIRLSCTVSTKHLDRIGVVDLYTLLGNAIDNAIEGVERLSDPEKKVISLTIQDQGQMLFFHIENYYDGKLQMSGGLPLTTKRDALNHGFGTKSIRAIAKRYGGEVMIRAEGGIFSLEVLLPS